VQEIVGGQLVQLDPVDEEQPTKEFVDWNRKAVSEEVNKSYLETDRKIRRILVFGHLHGLLV
jgi:hypothetical protein